MARFCLEGTLRVLQHRPLHLHRCFLKEVRKHYPLALLPDAPATLLAVEPGRQRYLSRPCHLYVITRTRAMLGGLSSKMGRL